MEKFKLRFLLFLMFCIFCSGATIGFGFSTNCKEVERNALLKLKHSFDDPFNFLGSWVGEDCCSWKGVACHNLTSNVFKLDLGMFTLAAGEVNPALLELKYLTYLDLSSIDFNGSTIPKFLGSMSQLQHLDLSFSNFAGEVPQNLGNLTELVSLYLSYEWRCYSNSLEWASKLENLQYLDLTWIDLSETTDSLNIALHKLLPSLLSLNLAGCQLGNSNQAMRNLSVSSSPLQYLDLSLNSFSGSFPSFIQNLSSIRSLNLGYNQLSSSLPVWLGNKLHLKELHMASNLFTGPFLSVIQNMSSIESIDLSYNSFKSSLPSWTANTKLKHLNLRQNSLYGPFPKFIQNSSSLAYIDLSSNQFSLSIPKWLAEKRELQYVDLSINQFDRVDEGITNTFGRLCNLYHLGISHNSIQEEVSETHANISRCAKYSLQWLYLSHNNLETVPQFFGSLQSLEWIDLSYNQLSVVNQASLANLSSLTYLDISSNPSLLLDVSRDWIPPFQLEQLDISPCKFNGPFPKWLLNQTQLMELDLSDTGIFGPLPHDIGNAMSSLWNLRLAKNCINGSIPKSLCDLPNLSVLDLRNNWLSGKIPDCWENSQTLEAVELSSNTLSGSIPKSLTEVPSLQLLSLNNNSLEELPEFMSIFHRLAVLDVGTNSLHGEIPPINGTNFPTLQVLILRENRFKGMVPPQLCSVRTLQVIDLSNNDLFGAIPQCFGFFEGMGSIQYPNDSTALPPSYTDIAWAPTVSPDEWSATEVLKGEVREYTSVLHLLVNIDLSCNNLEGVIPTNLTRLSLLIGLNLSHNHFTGEIPNEIGKMTRLESLDLSSNNLSGSIPESISSLHFLSMMNLSFNNLHGEIPTGQQLQVLGDPASMYWGNPGLCGDPLPNKCFSDGPPTSAIESEDEEGGKHEKMWFYMVILLGFACGFWGVIGTLVLKRGWRNAYFGLAEEIGDWLYVRVAMARARGGK